jgi:hypothetical protein
MPAQAVALSQFIAESIPPVAPAGTPVPAVTVTVVASAIVTDVAVKLPVAK